MPNAKRIVIGFTTSGNVPNVCIQRDSDSFFWSDGVGFIANSGNPFLNVMTETFDGFWVYETSFEVWVNGTYNIVIYEGSSSTSNVLIGYSQNVSADTLIGFVEAAGFTSKNAVSSIKTSLESLFGLATKQTVSLGLLSDRVHSLQQVLSRRDYGA